ncbi:MAG: DUF3187 family protein [Gammaproteobacteria bacterium]|nr:DUF3187 family protein [Gammaproteobacteria bacterium]
MLKRSPDCSFCIGAFLRPTFIACLAIATTVSAAQPFLTQDQNPFSLIQGQPQAVAAQLPEADTSLLSLTIDVTNTLNDETNNNESLFIDFESYNLRLAWLYGITEDWALKIDLPLIYYGEGFLDNTIDSWHEFFHLPRANRPNVTDNQFQILYDKNGQTLINLNTANSGLGDIQIALGKNIVKKHDSTLSFWVSADLPTGDPNYLRGNDHSDLSLWLASDYHFNPEWSIDTNAGVLFPGGNQISGIAVEDKVLFTYVGIQWQAHEIFNLRMQINAHSQFYSDSQLSLLGPAYNMVLGSQIHVSECSEIDLAFSEDIQVGATPDISFLLSWKSHLDCQ